MKNQEPNIDLFGYAVNAIRGLNKTAKRKLANPYPFIREENIMACAELLDKGENRVDGNINSQARVEKSDKKESFGSWEYHYGPDDCQRTVDWMLDNDPKYFMVHISGCRNRGRGQVYRMDNLQDYANQKLFGNQ
tara:strand:- start:161 stop:565 length:405 start_codon:yes stop_codon:yes gene_type:complete